MPESSGAIRTNTPISRQTAAPRQVECAGLPVKAGPRVRFHTGVGVQAPTSPLLRLGVVAEQVGEFGRAAADAILRDHAHSASLPSRSEHPAPQRDRGRPRAGSSGIADSRNPWCPLGSKRRRPAAPGELGLSALPPPFPGRGPLSTHLAVPPQADLHQDRRLVHGSQPGS